MRIVIVVLLALIACGNKDSAPAAGSAPATGSGSAATARPIDAAVAMAPDAASRDPAPVAASAGKVCCCESTGDATHFTIEGDASACTADDMRGTCEGLKECDLEAPPTVLAVGATVTIDTKKLVAIWPTKEPKAYGALEITLAGKHAVVRTNSSNDQGWKQSGKLPTAPGPVTVTVQADGTALVSNGKTTWVLAQEYRYGSITFKQRK